MWKLKRCCFPFPCRWMQPCTPYGSLVLIKTHANFNMVQYEIYAMLQKSCKKCHKRNNPSKSAKSLRLQHPNNYSTESRSPVTASCSLGLNICGSLCENRNLIYAFQSRLHLSQTVLPTDCYSVSSSKAGMKEILLISLDLFERQEENTIRWLWHLEDICWHRFCMNDLFDNSRVFLLRRPSQMLILGVAGRQQHF